MKESKHGPCASMTGWLMLTSCPGDFFKTVLDGHTCSLRPPLYCLKPCAYRGPSTVRVSLWASSEAATEAQVHSTLVSCWPKHNCKQNIVVGIVAVMKNGGKCWHSGNCG